ncbi:hypothetical protein RHMOL_Rhmol12G0123400 [Rhododendron molle]|uniref:Uncharacterized protein n=1 Tax=Rhododendron molle TaxID=49168 RepID=A0ACC0LH40_RHOML|nr:hypothetical protein RHMOL_Rhmol12G0123400 [Rhododendron molle]
MAGTITQITAILNPQCLTTTPNASSKRPTPKPISLQLSIQTLPKLISSYRPSETSIPSLAETAVAAAVFSALSSSEPAMAAQELAAIAEGSDNRGLALLLPIIPAIAWVLFNILQPALNQINRIRNK